MKAGARKLSIKLGASASLVTLQHKIKQQVLRCFASPPVPGAALGCLTFPVRELIINQE